MRVNSLKLIFLIGLTIFIPMLVVQGATDQTIVDEWNNVKVPPAPELKPVTLDPSNTAFLVLDMQNSLVDSRPRAVESLAKIQNFLITARSKRLMVVYSVTTNATPADIRKELTPEPGEPVVKSGVAKFFKTDLEKILLDKGIKTVVIAGTVANGAVLHTATGASLRGFQVIVPVDGMSADNLYSEQYTTWDLVNGPGTRKQVTVTKFSLIRCGDAPCDGTPPVEQ